MADPFVRRRKGYGIHDEYIDEELWELYDNDPKVYALVQLVFRKGSLRYLAHMMWRRLTHDW